MYSEYCRLRDEIACYVEVDDRGDEENSWSRYDYTDPNYEGRMFNIYWDEIDDNTTKFYTTHAFSYSIVLTIIHYGLMSMLFREIKRDWKIS